MSQIIPRGRPRNQATHEAILEAANAILASEGYSGFTIEGVAAKAGVSKTSIYRRWTSKGDLLLDMYMVDLAEDPVPIEGLTFRESLENFLALSVKKVETPWWRATIQSLIAEAQGDADLASAVREKIIAPRREHTRTLIKNGIRNGSIRAEIDIDIVLDMIFGAMWYRLLLGHAPYDRAFAHALVDQLFAWIEAWPERCEASKKQPL